MTQFSPILSLGLVSPGFLIAGALLVGVPILIHILNRRRFKTVTWAAMEYLLRAMRKNRRRLKFEQWMLLATRCLVLLLLGLALARPLGCERTTLATIGGRTGLSVFVVDNSYSMGYRVNRGPDVQTHLDAAKKVAKGIIDRLSPGGESVAIITAASPATAVIARPGYDLTAAKAAIDRIEQSASSTDMAGALQLALQIGREAQNQPNRSLYLLDDSTNGAWKTPRADAVKQAAQELAKLYRVSHHNLAQGQTQWNAAILSVEPDANLVTNKFGANFAADVRGFGPAPKEMLRWRLGNEALEGTDPREVTPEPKPALQTKAHFTTGGPQVMSVSLVPADAGSTDRLPVDNTRYRVIDVASELKVLIVEGERGINPLEGSGAFLQLALAPPKQQPTPTSQPSEIPAAAAGKSDSYVSPELISDLELGNKLLGEYAAVVLTDVGQIAPTQADALQTFVRHGGTLMLFMGKQVDAESYNSVLLPRKLMPGALVKRMSTAADQAGYSFDFDPSNPKHRFLEIFREQPESGLTRARVFSYWQVDLPGNSSVERVLSYQSAGGAGGSGAGSGKAVADPAITVHSLGQGRVVFVSTTANPDPEWTSFPAKMAYVSLMHELLAGSVRTGDHWLNLTVGQSLTVPPTVRLTATPTLTDPDKHPVVIDGVPAADDNREIVYRSRPLTRPGLYTLSVGAAQLPVAVNVPADEADVRTVNDDALREALGGIDVSVMGPDLPSEAAMADAGNDFGWNFMVLVLVLLGVECFMAMRFGHYRRSDAVRQSAPAA
jgi:hypothetical protein